MFNVTNNDLSSTLSISYLVLNHNNNNNENNAIININWEITLKKSFYSFIIAIISLTAIFGNACVIIVMIREKTLRTISNTFILSLSISDLMVGLFVTPLSATIILYDKWIWGFLICRGWLSIDYIASTASIFNLFTLSIFSIVEPLRYMTYKSKLKANCAILIVWFISFLWIIPINFWNLYYVSVDNKNDETKPPNNSIKMTRIALTKKPTTTTKTTSTATLADFITSLVDYSTNNENIFTISTHTNQTYPDSSDTDSIYNVDTELKCATDFETNKAFKIITTIFNFYVPLIGMILIYFKIFMTIKRRSESELGEQIQTRRSSKFSFSFNTNKKKSSSHDAMIRQNFHSDSNIKSTQSDSNREISNTTTTNNNTSITTSYLLPDGTINSSVSNQNIRHDSNRLEIDNLNNFQQTSIIRKNNSVVKNRKNPTNNIYSSNSNLFPQQTQQTPTTPTPTTATATNENNKYLKENTKANGENDDDDDYNKKIISNSNNEIINSTVNKTTEYVKQISANNNNNNHESDRQHKQIDECHHHHHQNNQLNTINSIKSNRISITDNKLSKQRSLDLDNLNPNCRIDIQQQQQPKNNSTPTSDSGGTTTTTTTATTTTTTTTSNANATPSTLVNAVYNRSNSRVHHRTSCTLIKPNNNNSNSNNNSKVHQFQNDYYYLIKLLKSSESNSKKEAYIKSYRRRNGLNDFYINMHRFSIGNTATKTVSSNSENSFNKNLALNEANNNTSSTIMSQQLSSSDSTQQQQQKIPLDGFLTKKNFDKVNYIREYNTFQMNGRLLATRNNHLGDSSVVSIGLNKLLKNSGVNLDGSLSLPLDVHNSDRANAKSKYLEKFLCINKYKKKNRFSSKLKQQIKAAKQLGILLSAFLLLWMPYFIVFIVVAFCADCVSEKISTVCLWLGYLNSAINPILYPLCNSGFRDAFRKMFKLGRSEPKRRDLIKMMYYSTK